MSNPFDSASGEAQILDRGYRRYDGPRTGTRGAVRTLVSHSIQRGLGLRRSFWAKLLPIATVAVSYVPAIVFVGISALVPTEEIDFILPTYGDYYSFVIAAIMVFVALSAPEMLCTDRRSGMLGVYLASPLDRATYLVGKALAVGAVLSLVCLGPPLLMLVANILQNTGPDGLAEILSTLGDTLLAGLALTVVYTSVTMGIASLTDRKSVASASIIMMFLVAITVTGIFHAAGAPEGIFNLSVTMLSLELGGRIHGDYIGVMPTVPTSTIWLAWLAWTVAGFAIAWFQIQRLPVTR